MKVTILSRVFRGRHPESPPSDEVLLADFNVAPRRIINVTPAPAAAADLERLKEQLEQLTAEVNLLRERIDAQAAALRELHGAAQWQNGKVREIASALKAFAQALLRRPK